MSSCHPEPITRPSVTTKPHFNERHNDQRPDPRHDAITTPQHDNTTAQHDSDDSARTAGEGRQFPRRLQPSLLSPLSLPHASQIIHWSLRDCSAFVRVVAVSE